MKICEQDKNKLHRVMVSALATSSSGITGLETINDNFCLCDLEDRAILYKDAYSGVGYSKINGIEYHVNFYFSDYVIANEFKTWLDKII